MKKTITALVGAAVICAALPLSCFAQEAGAAKEDSFEYEYEYSIKVKGSGSPQFGSDNGGGQESQEPVKAANTGSGSYSNQGGYGGMNNYGGQGGYGGTNGYGGQGGYGGTNGYGSQGGYGGMNSYGSQGNYGTSPGMYGTGGSGNTNGQGNYGTGNMGGYGNYGYGTPDNGMDAYGTDGGYGSNYLPDTSGSGTGYNNPAGSGNLYGNNYGQTGGSFNGYGYGMNPGGMNGAVGGAETENGSGQSRMPGSKPEGNAIYDVEDEDTLWEISGKYRVELDDMIEANPHIDDPDMIYPEDSVVIPPSDGSFIGMSMNDAGDGKTDTKGAVLGKYSGTKSKGKSNELESKVYALVNEERVKNGLGKLEPNAQLSNLARVKAEDMRDNGYFDHTSKTYGSPFQMMKEFGIMYRTAGENIAKGQKTAEDVMKAWMASEGHKKNIMNPDYSSVGIGCVADGAGNTYWVQMFVGQ